MIKMKHEKTGGVAECPSEEALVYWGQLGWKRADDNAQLTSEAVNAQVNPQQFQQPEPRNLAEAVARDAAERAAAVGEEAPEPVDVAVDVDDKDDDDAKSVDSSPEKKSDAKDSDEAAARDAQARAATIPESGAKPGAKPR